MEKRGNSNSSREFRALLFSCLAGAIFLFINIKTKLFRGGLLEDDLAHIYSFVHGVTAGKGPLESTILLTSAGNGEWSLPLVNLGVFFLNHLFSWSTTPLFVFQFFVHIFIAIIMGLLVLRHFQFSLVGSISLALLWMSAYPHFNAYLWFPAFQHQQVLLGIFTTVFLLLESWKEENKFWQILQLIYLGVGLICSLGKPTTLLIPISALILVGQQIKQGNTQRLRIPLIGIFSFGLYPLYSICFGGTGFSLHKFMQIIPSFILPVGHAPVYLFLRLLLLYWALIIGFCWLRRNSWFNKILIPFVVIFTGLNIIFFDHLGPLMATFKLIFNPLLSALAAEVYRWQLLDSDHYHFIFTGISYLVVILAAGALIRKMEKSGEGPKFLIFLLPTLVGSFFYFVTKNPYYSRYAIFFTPMACLLISFLLMELSQNLGKRRKFFQRGGLCLIFLICFGNSLSINMRLRRSAVKDGLWTAYALQLGLLLTQRKESPTKICIENPVFNLKKRAGLKVVEFEFSNMGNFLKHTLSAQLNLSAPIEISSGDCGSSKLVITYQKGIPSIGNEQREPIHQIYQEQKENKRSTALSVESLTRAAPFPLNTLLGNLSLRFLPCLNPDIGIDQFMENYGKTRMYSTSLEKWAELRSMFSRFQEWPTMGQSKDSCPWISFITAILNPFT